MSTSQRTVLGVLVVVVLAVAGVGGYLLWDQNRDHRDYPEQVRGNFLVSCAANGGADKDCNCLLDEIEEHADLARFTVLEREVLGGGAPEIYTDALAACGADLSTLGPPPSATATTTLPASTTTTRRSSSTTRTSVDHFQERLKTIRNPDSGLWKADGDACYVKVSQGGSVLVEVVDSTVTVPQGADKFVYDSACTWTYDGYQGDDL